MKWVSLIIGGVIIVGGIWLLVSPDKADGPAVETPTEETAMEEAEHGGVMEDGTVDSKDSNGGSAMENKTTADSSTEQPNKTQPVMETTDAMEEEEPTGDTVLHTLVEYTNSGFSPATVTINKGETVRFVNQASSGMWVAGNNHPTHTIYPEKAASDCLGTSFDTCRALQGGEFWEFTFNHAGSWGFHNHVRSNNGGTVVVK